MYMYISHLSVSSIIHGISLTGLISKLKLPTALITFLIQFIESKGETLQIVPSKVDFSPAKESF